MGEISKMEADLAKKHQEELKELKENDTPSFQPESQVCSSLQSQQDPDKGRLVF